MAKKKREQTTRRMPSGAQQYVRPAATENAPSVRRMETLVNMRPRLDPETDRGFITDAVIDESRLNTVGYTNEEQARSEDRANRRGAKRFVGGGMVRGHKSIQIAGNNFRGSF
jgi:hypothetical protein